MSKKGLFSSLPGGEASFYFLLKLVENLDANSLKELVKTSLFKDLIINEQLQQKLAKLINKKLYQFRNSLTIEVKLSVDVYSKLVAFNNDDTNIISVSDNKLRVWNVDTGECISTLECNPYYVRSVGFNHDGTKIVSTSWNDTIRVWNVDTSECIVTLECHHDGTNIQFFLRGVNQCVD